MLKRALITGVLSTGVDIADLRVLPSAVNRHLLKSENFDAGVHIGVNAADPEVVAIQFYERPGIQLTAALQKEIEKNFTRHEARRVGAADVGTISYPARAADGYAADLLSGLDIEAIRARGFRIVVDYGYSAASLVLPLVLEPLGVEVVAAHTFTTGRHTPTVPPLHEAIGQTKNLVRAVGAEMGVVFDRAAERVYLVDEQAKEVPVDKALLLYLRLISSDGRRGRLAFPITVTSLVDQLVEGSDLEVIRTPATLADLTKAAAGDNVVFAGARRRRLRLPGVPARLRRRREPLQAARAPRAGPAAAVGARGRPAGLDARPPAAPLPVGAQGHGHAPAHRAVPRPRRRPARRDQGLRRARLGAGAARSGRAARPHLRRGPHRRGVRRSSRPSSGGSSRRSCRRRKAPPVS